MTIMTKEEWVALSKDERLTQLRAFLQSLIRLEKEQDDCCKKKIQFKKTHQKIQLEKQITNYLEWDKEL